MFPWAFRSLIPTYLWSRPFLSVDFFSFQAGLNRPIRLVTLSLVVRVFADLIRLRLISIHKFKPRLHILALLALRFLRGFFAFIWLMRRWYGGLFCVTYLSILVILVLVWWVLSWTEWLLNYVCYPIWKRWRLICLKRCSIELWYLHSHVRDFLFLVSRR